MFVKYIWIFYILYEIQNSPKQALLNPVDIFLNLKNTVYTL